MIKILVVFKPDKGANGVRSLKIKSFLSKHGYIVTLHKIGNGDIDVGKTISRQKLRRNLLPKAARNVLFIMHSLWEGRKLALVIKNQGYRAVICESEISALCFFFLDKNVIKILDSPSPWIPEWQYSNDLSILIKPLAYWLEIRLYRRSDAISFHWENYAQYTKENIYKSDKIFTLNWGCESRNIKAKYSSKPKIAFLGKLDGYWNDLSLLSRLTKQYEIDVYGSPKPPKHLGLNYKGFAPTTDVLSNYQLGLITISKDALRRQSFSSKHLDYMSYGLPVLTPEWRHDSALAQYSIYYNEENFLDKLHEYSTSKRWQQMSDKCYYQAKLWNWDNNLMPLLDIIKDKSAGNVAKT